MSLANRLAGHDPDVVLDLQAVFDRCYDEAASCWAQAGNFYRAITLCDGLLAHLNLSDRLRRRVHDYADTLRTRRTQWYAGLMLETAGSEG